MIRKHSVDLLDQRGEGDGIRERHRRKEQEGKGMRRVLKSEEDREQDEGGI